MYLGVNSILMLYYKGHRTSAMDSFLSTRVAYIFYYETFVVLYICIYIYIKRMIHLPRGYYIHSPHSYQCGSTPHMTMHLFIQMDIYGVAFNLSAGAGNQ